MSHTEPESGTDMERVTGGSSVSEDLQEEI